MKIDETKLAALHDYLVAGGSPEQVDVAQQIGADPDDTEQVDAYVEALKARWPETYGDPETPAAPAQPARKTAKKAAKTATPASTYRLRRADGTVVALEVLKVSDNGTVILEEPRQKDLVTLLLRGRQITVDLIELRAKPAGSMLHDLPVTKVIELAELAKA
jgi:hypothetical protein